MAELNGEQMGPIELMKNYLLIGDFPVRGGKVPIKVTNDLCGRLSEILSKRGEGVDASDFLAVEFRKNGIVDQIQFNVIGLSDISSW